jgi:hypothetical protein
MLNLCVTLTPQEAGLPVVIFTGKNTFLIQTKQKAGLRKFTRANLDNVLGLQLLPIGLAHTLKWKMKHLKRFAMALRT